MNEFNPDWDQMAVLVTHSQEQAAKIEQLEKKLAERSTDLRQAAQQALEALEFIPESGSMLGAQAEAKRIDAITVLRTALEQP